MTACPSNFEPKARPDWDFYCAARDDARDKREFFECQLRFALVRRPCGDAYWLVRALQETAAEWADAQGDAAECRDGEWWRQERDVFVDGCGPDWWADVLADCACLQELFDALNDEGDDDDDC